MTDELDRDVQDWFKRSSEQIPEQPFAVGVMERIWRRELRLRLQGYAALLAAFASFVLLLPWLSAWLDALIALPLTVADAGGRQGPVLLIAAVGLAYAWAWRAARR